VVKIKNSKKTTYTVMRFSDSPEISQYLPDGVFATFCKMCVRVSERECMFVRTLFREHEQRKCFFYFLFSKNSKFEFLNLKSYTMMKGLIFVRRTTG